MIKADHKAYAHFLIRNYINYNLKHSFHSIGLIGEMPKPDPGLPLIITPNHFSWWDGFFGYYLNEKLFHRKFHIMMLERQLRKYPLFAKCGAFSIDPASMRSYIATFRYVHELIAQYGGNFLLYYYPQGEMKFHREPIEFRRGIEKLVIALDRPVGLMTLAVRVELTTEQFPDIYIKFGELRRCDKSNAPTADNLAAEISQNLESIDCSIIAGESQTILMSGRKTAGS
ncbi:MAG: lysophospholipid acyltransferase family protein [Candidatus Kapaibacterium sp.]